MQLTNRIYDMDERVIEETMQINGRTVVNRYQPDEKGLTQTRVYQGDRLLSVTKRTVNGGFIKTVYATDSQPTSVIQVDDHGHLVCLKFLKDAQSEVVYHFGYDAYNNLVKQTVSPGAKVLEQVAEYWREPVRTTRFSSRNGLAVSYQEGSPEDTNEYDGITRGTFKNGQIDLVVIQDSYGHPRQVEQYRNGNIWKELLISQTGKLTSQTTYETHRIDQMDVKAIRKYTYDDLGNVQTVSTNESHYYPFGVLRTELTQVDGRLMSKTFHARDAQNNLVAKIVCEYNPYGQCVKETKYGAHGELQKSLLYEYNAAGQCKNIYHLSEGKWVSSKDPNKEFQAASSGAQSVKDASALARAVALDRAK